MENNFFPFMVFDEEPLLNFIHPLLLFFSRYPFMGLIHFYMMGFSSFIYMNG